MFKYHSDMGHCFSLVVNKKKFLKTAFFKNDLTGVFMVPCTIAPLTLVKVFTINPEIRILRLLKMLNSADNNSFSDLVSIYLKVFDLLIWNF